MENKDNLLFKIISYISAIFMVGIVLLVFTNAVLRYFFNSSYPPGEEISRYLFIWISFLGAVLAFKDKLHVGVDVFTKNLKGSPKIIVEAVSSFVMLACFGIILYGGFQFTKVSGASIGPTTGLPFGVVSITIIIAAILIIGLIVKQFIDTYKENIQGGKK